MSERKAKKSAAPPEARRRVMWVPVHKAWSPINPADFGIEVRVYDPADPPPDFPGRPGLMEPDL